MRLNRSAVSAFCIMLATVTLPSLIYVSLGASSMAAGVLAVCFIIVVTAGRMRLPLSFIRISILFF